MQTVPTFNTKPFKLCEPRPRRDHVSSDMHYKSIDEIRNKKQSTDMNISLSKWHQLDKYTEEMYVKSLQDNSDGLKVFLHNITNTINISIVFTEVLSYRNTDESYLLKVWDSYEEGVLKGSFFMYTDSDFIDYFNDMTYGLHKELAIKHYAIFTDSDCIEVLSVKEPLIVQDI